MCENSAFSVSNRATDQLTCFFSAALKAAIEKQQAQDECVFLILNTEFIFSKPSSFQNEQSSINLHFMRFSFREPNLGEFHDFILNYYGTWQDLGKSLFVFLVNETPQIL